MADDTSDQTPPQKEPSEHEPQRSEPQAQPPSEESQYEPRRTDATSGTWSSAEPTVEIGREERTEQLPVPPTPPAGPEAARPPAPEAPAGAPAYPPAPQGPQAQPPAGPYGQPYSQQQYGQQQHGQQPYSQHQYGQPPYGYGQPPAGYTYPQPGQPAYNPYATSPAHTTTPNVSAIVLVVISGLLTLGTCIVGLPSLVMAILALTKQDTDPEGSRRLTRWGWITLAILFVLAVLAATLIIAIAVSRSNFDPYTTY